MKAIKFQVSKITRIKWKVSWCQENFWSSKLLLDYRIQLSLLERWVQVTPFLHRRFLKDPTIKKDTIKCYCFPLLSLSLFIVFHLIKGHLPFSTTHFSNESLRARLVCNMSLLNFHHSSLKIPQFPKPPIWHLNSDSVFNFKSCS